MDCRTDYFKKDIFSKITSCGLKNAIYQEQYRVKGIGPQTIVRAFYESLHVAEQFATKRDVH